MRIEDLSDVCDLSGERERLLRDIDAVEALDDVVVTLRGSRVDRPMLDAVQPVILAQLRGRLAAAERALAGLGVRV